MDPHPRDETTEVVLGEIIAHGSDAVLSFLNDTCTDGLERQDEEAGYDDDQTMEGEGHRDDGSGDRIESGHVYILVKPVLTSSLLEKGLLVAHQFCLLMAHYWCATSTTPLVLYTNGAPKVRH